MGGCNSRSEHECIDGCDIGGCEYENIIVNVGEYGHYLNEMITRSRQRLYILTSPRSDTYITAMLSSADNHIPCYNNSTTNPCSINPCPYTALTLVHTVDARYYLNPRVCR